MSDATGNAGGRCRVAGHRSVGLGVRPLMRTTAITGLAGNVLPQVEITTYGATPLAYRSGEHIAMRFTNRGTNDD